MEKQPDRDTIADEADSAAVVSTGNVVSVISVSSHMLLIYPNQRSSALGRRKHPSRLTHRESHTPTALPNSLEPPRTLFPTSLPTQTGPASLRRSRRLRFETLPSAPYSNAQERQWRPSLSGEQAAPPLTKVDILIVAFVSSLWFWAAIGQLSWLRCNN
jgi:hypothetical protein